MRQQGSSLVELMVALLLSSFLCALLIQQYLISKRHYLDVQKTLSQSSELVWITELLRNSIRHAGFTPCANINQLQGVDHRSQSPIPQAIALDELNITRMSTDFSPVIRQQFDKVSVTNNTRFKVGQLVLVSDCFHAEIEHISAISHGGNEAILHLSAPLTFVYQSPIFVGEWLEERFFIRKNTQGEKALYYQQQQSEELSDAIDELTAEDQQGVLLITLRLKKGELIPLKTRVRSQ